MSTIIKIARRASCAAAAIFACAMTAAPSFATATITSGGVYEDFASNYCAATTCELTFPETPPLGKTLIVTQLSCNIQTTGSGIWQAYLTSPGTVHKVYFLPTLSVSIPTRNVYLVNVDATHVVRGLTHPGIVLKSLKAGKVLSAECNITGRLE